MLNRIKRQVLFCLLFLGAQHASAQLPQPQRPAGQQKERPNILIILADDLGFSDLGCYGGEVESPNLDQLAENGLRYKQFYNAARCCPSRAALMTGLYPHQTGMGWMAAADLGTPAYSGTLNEQSVTIAEVLKTAGYSTYMTGKWHLTNHRKIDGHVTDSWPAHRGFDRFFGLIRGGANYFTPEVCSNDSVYQSPPDFYLTDAISDTTVKFLDEHFRQKGESPFFMYVAYTAPHWPLHAFKETIQKYRERYLRGWDETRKERFERQQKMDLFGLETRMTDRDPEVPAWNGLSAEKREEMAMRMAIYAAQIDIMDQGIGRIMQTLRQAGQLDNTLVFFLSDNGACAEFISSGKSKAVDGSENTFESYRIHWANVGSTPFKEYKHFTHEGGIATPLIVHWPDGIKKELRSSYVTEYGHLTDLMATCVEVAGATYPETYRGKPIHPLEGKSLLPHFSGKRNNRGRIFWEHEANIAVRDGMWKLVAKTVQDDQFDPSKLELYNMEEDPIEMHDQAAAHPEIVDELYSAWQKWAEQVGVFPMDTRGYGARMQAYRRDINGEFDDRLGGWNTPAGKELVSVDTTGRLSGKNSLRIVAAGGDAAPDLPVLAWPFQAKQGESFSLRLAAGSEREARVIVKLESTAAEGPVVLEQQISTQGGKREFSFDASSLPQDGTYRLALYLSPSATGSELWIDRIELSPRP